MTSSRYATVPMALHWLMAIALLAQLTLGFWMVSLPDEPPGVQVRWFNLHKSIGMLLGVAVLLRLVARWRWRPPAPPAALPRWQQQAAGVTHALLYGCMVVLPVSGLLGSGFTKYPVKFFGTALPRWSDPWPAAKSLCSAVHEAAVWLMLAALVLHIAAAAWHLLQGDGIGRRMGLGR